MHHNVIIVGAGPVGLSLAVGLAHYGVPSLLVEKRREPMKESRAIFMFARSLEIFRNWGGIHEALIENGLFYKNFSVVEPNFERRVLTFDWGCVDDVVNPAGGLIIPQDRTEAVLREVVGRRAECRLEIGDVVEVEQDSERVKICLSDGRVLTADILVACDGARSVVRQRIGLRLIGKTYDTCMVLSDVRIRGADQSLHPLRFALKWRGFLAGIRYAPDLWRIIGSLPNGMDEALALSAAEHESRVRALFGSRQTEMVWQSFFRIHKRHSPAFRVGRIALAGDAAHINSPAGGQGMNGGIHDAANLAWKLGAVFIRGSNLETMLDSYDAERRTLVADEIERTTDWLSQLEFSASPMVRHCAVTIVDLLEHCPAFRHRLAYAASMLGFRYKTSSLLMGNHRLVGTRLDDVVLSDGRRISSFAGLWGAVLVTDAIAGQTPLVAEQFDGLPIVHFTPPNKWRLPCGAAVIVRPDGHVGAIVEEVTLQKLRSALNHCFAQNVTHHTAP